MDSHRCKCKKTCKAKVVTPGRNYARGHSPASHQDYDTRGRKISKTVRKQFEEGRINAFCKGSQHSEKTKKKMSIAAKESRKDLKSMARRKKAIALRSKNEAWRAAAKKNLAKATQRNKGTPRTAETKAKIALGAKKARRKKNWAPWNKGLQGGQVAWNKGLTKATDERIARGARSLQKAYAEGRKQITSRRSWQVQYLAKDGITYTFRSKLELNFARWCDQKGVPWEYEPKTFRVKMPWGETTYTPDFYLVKQNAFVELKGRLMEKEAKKYRQFQQQYPQVPWYLLMSETLQAVGIN